MAAAVGLCYSTHLRILDEPSLSVKVFRHFLGTAFHWANIASSLLRGRGWRINLVRCGGRMHLTMCSRRAFVLLTVPKPYYHLPSSWIFC
jgi:hypothetical protein